MKSSLVLSLFLIVACSATSVDEVGSTQEGLAARNRAACPAGEYACPCDVNSDRPSYYCLAGNEECRAPQAVCPAPSCPLGHACPCQRACQPSFYCAPHVVTCIAPSAACP